MKKQAISISVLSGVLLFSGPIVIAGESTGWQSESRLLIHRGEFCREAMIEELEVPKEEIDRLEAGSVPAG